MACYSKHGCGQNENNYFVQKFSIFSSHFKEKVLFFSVFMFDYLEILGEQLQNVFIGSLQISLTNKNVYASESKSYLKYYLINVYSDQITVRKGCSNKVGKRCLQNC